ncbi:MAG: hypothetical protein IKA45_04395 [Bacteroidales bacterium]|nr:hypothetical protein [Bacteroidales bacterium]
MSEKISGDILEWLTKEDERFSLRKLGLYTDINKAVEDLGSSAYREADESYSEWKQRVLAHFYEQTGFSSFYSQNRGEKLFKRGIRSLLKAKLSDMFHHSEQTDTDKYIAPDHDTISYSLSEENFERISEEHLSGEIQDTLEISSICNSALKQNYPLAEEYVIDHLQTNDSFYWEKVYLRLKPMVEGFSYQMSGSNAQDQTYDIWSDTCMIINTAVTEKRLSQPCHAKDIISYAVGIIKNKNRELLKGIKKGRNISLDQVSYKVEYSPDENFFNREEAAPQNFSSQNPTVTNYIDITDEVDIRNHMVLALYNEKHPLHQALISGYEEAVGLLFEHYIDGVSYDDIVIKRMGHLPEKEMIKNVARVRQEVKRVKERLIKRFIKLIKNDRR